MEKEDDQEDDTEDDTSEEENHLEENEILTETVQKRAMAGKNNFFEDYFSHANKKYKNGFFIEKKSFFTMIERIFIEKS